MSTAEKLEDIIIRNSLSRKVNVAETDFLVPYSPADDNYAKAPDLSSYMGARVMDVGMIKDILNCNKAL